MSNTKLTAMQAHFLQKINDEQREVSANFLAQDYYNSIGKTRPVASRDCFGQTSAAYRTCRKLVELKLIEQVSKKNSGWLYIMFKSIKNE